MTAERGEEIRNIIGIYHLSKRYNEKFALDDINLHVANGEFVFLVGPSGAGKSTLLKLIYMDDFPTEGQVIVGPFVSTQMKRSKVSLLRRKIGVVFQSFRLLYDRDVFENVAIAMRVTGESSYEIKKKVAQVLTQVGLYHKRNEMPSTLSGGEQQRIAIARAVVNSPAVLLADEPTGNLDPEVTEEILKLLFHINAGGTAVLMATHDLALVKQFGQRILFLRDGRLQEDKILGYKGDLSQRLERIQKDPGRFGPGWNPGTK
ncbi:MAG: cell division ATP-binding protein FtsE [Chitinivibrionia bacterium]|nr:cell division ATP-binding protein FtsE [Chitinivibrionia bacterium]